MVQGPGAPEENPTDGFANGGWLVPYADNDMGEIMAGIFAEADAFLLGRRTYEIFAGHWPQVADENPIAAALNRLPKHVVSTTLTGALEWPGAELIDADVVERVAALKARPGRELQVHGSGRLIGTLIAHDLDDEYRLLVHPVFLGTGRRLFDDPALSGALTLITSRTTAAGVVMLSYGPVGTVRQGSFARSSEPAEHRMLR